MAEPDPRDLLRALADTAADVGAAIQPAGFEELLTSIAEHARQVTGAGASSIALLDEQAGELEFVAATGPGGEALVGTRMDSGKGIAGWALASGQSITVNDAPSDPRFAADVAATTGYTPHTILAIPLEDERGPVGVMEVLDPDPASDGDRGAGAMLSLLAEQAALAIASAAVFDDLGKAVFAAAARAAAANPDAGGLVDVFEEVAADARGPSRKMAGLLASFYEVAQLGVEERDAAEALLTAFLRYARASRPLP